MSAIKIGQQLVALCQERKNLEAVNQLYDENVVSVEAADPPQMEREARGIDAVRGKNQWWGENHEAGKGISEGPARGLL